MDELEIEAFIKEIREELPYALAGDHEVTVAAAFSDLLESAAIHLQACLDWKREHRRWNNCTPRKKART